MSTKPLRAARPHHAVLPLLFAALWPVPGCNARRLQAPARPLDQETPQAWPQDLTKALDIVFMIDNSSSMDSVQQLITANFPRFMNVLKAVPGGLPDVHIGVISSSLGAGASSDVAGCPPGGDRGAFQSSPRGDHGACTHVPRDHFIASAQGGTKNNFDGDITDVFACIAELGSDGCGFEHQLAAVKRALGGDPGGAPPENAGFLRENALLAVVLITNEDDCSAPPDSDLFGSPEDGVSDPLGPLANFRCNEFGHLCGGVPPPRTPAPNLQDCHSAEGAGRLIKVSNVVGFLKGLKKNPAKVFVAAIAAPPTPYTVLTDEEGGPEIAHSCTGADGSYGDPAVRLKDFVDAFGKNGLFTSICSPDYGPPLEEIARRVALPFLHQCVDGALVDADPAAPGVQPDCSVVDRTITGPDSAVESPLGQCPTSSGACWRLQANPRECPISGYEIQIDRPAPAPPDTITEVRCATCADVDDPRCQG